jgi:hypothetical protein
MAAIEERTTASEAALQMVDVVVLCEELGLEKVELAVRGALAASALDGRAVAVLARRGGSARSPNPMLTWRSAWPRWPPRRRTSPNTTSC